MKEGNHGSSLPYFRQRASQKFLELVLERGEGEGLASWAGVEDERPILGAPWTYNGKDTALQKVPGYGEPCYLFRDHHGAAALCLV